jgi:hypothetical protein
MTTEETTTKENIVPITPNGAQESKYAPTTTCTNMQTDTIGEMDNATANKTANRKYSPVDVAPENDQVQLLKRKDTKDTTLTTSTPQHQ